jgi:hypothetical protein
VKPGSSTDIVDWIRQAARSDDTPDRLLVNDPPGDMAAPNTADDVPG